MDEKWFWSGDVLGLAVLIMIFEWDASASHPGKKNQELLPGKMMKCTCYHPGIARASSQNQAVFSSISNLLNVVPFSHLIPSHPNWVCLKMLCTPTANGFADHYPVLKNG